MKIIKLNIQKIIVSFFNTILSLSFFFCVRRFLLRCFGISVGEKATIHRGVKLFCPGNLTIGNRTTVNYQCFLDARGKLVVGNNVNISHCVKIYTMGHDINDPFSKTVSKTVVIKDNAWIFPNVLVMPGVTIGEGAVVYPGSVVTKSLDAYTIYAGNPARPVGKRNSNIAYSSEFPIWYGI